MPFGPPIPLDGLAPDATAYGAERFNEFQTDGLGYLHLQSTRPQTLGYALTDSPVGQLAWIVEKFHEWTDPGDRAAGGRGRPRPAADEREHLLVHRCGRARRPTRPTRGCRPTGDGGASWAEGDGGHEMPAGPPTGYAVFAGDNTIRSLVDPAGAIAHWSEFDRGGHFPAMEVPDLLAGDIREFFRPLR